MKNLWRNILPTPWLLFLGLAYCPLAFSLSQRTIDIFNKKNRVLDPPPKALRADSAQLDYRMKSEADRIDHPATNSAGPGFASADINDDDSKGEHVPEIQSPHDRIRSAKRKKSLENYSFTGERVFGVGFVGAGAYGVFGTEIDIALADDWFFGAGLGTGMSYSTWGLHSRYFLKTGRLNTFAEFGYADWYLGKISATGRPVTPEFLADRFFRDKDGTLTPGKRVHLGYPGIGVMYQHQSGLAAMAELQYLINLMDFSGGLFGSLGLYYYF